MNTNELTIEELKNIHNLYLRKAYPLTKDAKKQYNLAYKQKFTKEQINEYQRQKYRERKAKIANKLEDVPIKLEVMPNLQNNIDILKVLEISNDA